MRLTIGTLDLQSYIDTGGRAMGGIELADGDRTLLSGSLEELRRDGLGALAPFRDGVSDLLIAYVELENLDFLRFLPNLRAARLLSSRLGDVNGLRYLQKLTSLSLERPSYRLDVVGELAELTDLYLDDWRPGADSIFRLSKLRRVGIQKYGYPTLEPAGAWTNLENLWINAGRLDDLKGIPLSITKLELTCQRTLASLRPLSECRRLGELQLESCRKIDSLDGLEGCEQLRRVGIARCDRIESLAPLAGLPLEFLFLADGTTVDDVEGIYSLSNLKTLIIVRTAGVDVQRMLQVAPGCEIRITKR